MTIKEAMKALQAAVSEAVPGMVVSISLVLPDNADELNDNNTTVKTTDIKDIPPDLAKEIDMAALRKTLNAYVKKVGKDKAFELVEKYTGGSRNPADIPSEKYSDLLNEMGELEISFEGEPKEAA